MLKGGPSPVVTKSTERQALVVNGKTDDIVDILVVMKRTTPVASRFLSSQHLDCKGLFEPLRWYSR